MVRIDPSDLCNFPNLFFIETLNVERCEACWIGAEQDNTDKHINRKWINIASEALLTLGIYNSCDTDLAEKLNFPDNLKPFSDVIRAWKPRGLSLAGKILVFKTLAISKFLYVCTFKNPSTQIIESLNLIQKKFIWSKKRSKIKHSTLITDYKDGGYKYIDIEAKLSSLKVKWVSHLLDDNFHPWKIIPNLFFSGVGGNKTIFHFNLQLSEACLAKITNFPLFYQQLIQIWAKVSKRDPTQASDPTYEICKEILWNNSCITCGGKSLYNQYFRTKGIMCIIDIMDENGILLKWEKAKQKYDLNISSYLSWLGLNKSILTAWKFNLRDTLFGNTLRIDLQNESMACLSSKMAYQKLIQPLSQPTTSQLYFEKC